MCEDHNYDIYRTYSDYQSPACQSTASVCPKMEKDLIEDCNINCNWDTVSSKCVDKTEEDLLKKINDKYEIIKKTVNQIEQLDPKNKIVKDFNKRKKGFDTNINKYKKDINLNTITKIYGIYGILSEKMINEEKRLQKEIQNKLNSLPTVKEKKRK
jgi:hypothetical protein